MAWTYRVENYGRWGHDHVVMGVQIAISNDGKFVGRKMLKFGFSASPDEIMTTLAAEAAAWRDAGGPPPPPPPPPPPAPPPASAALHAAFPSLLDTVFEVP